MVTAVIFQMGQSWLLVIKSTGLHWGVEQTGIENVVPSDLPDSSAVPLHRDPGRRPGVRGQTRPLFGHLDTR